MGMHTTGSLGNRIKSLYMYFIDAHRRCCVVLIVVINGFVVDQLLLGLLILWLVGANTCFYGKPISKICICVLCHVGNYGSCKIFSAFDVV